MNAGKFLPVAQYMAPLKASPWTLTLFSLPLLVMGVAPIIAPIGGGLVTFACAWRYVFVIDFDFNTIADCIVALSTGK
jgi:hypothetical protein